MPALSTTLAITLRPATGGAAPVHGWYVSGNDPAEWLGELLRAGLKLEHARVMVMPGANGALVSVPEGSVPQSLPRAVPFTCRHGLLWIPCDAAVSPALAPEEVAALCPWAAVVWHPAYPPAAFEASDLLPVSSLMQPPLSHPGAVWTGAVPVDPMLSELRSVRLAIVFDEKALFGEEEKRIGSEPVQGLPDRAGSRRGSWRDWISSALSAARKKPARPTAATGPLFDTAGRWRNPGWLGLLLGVIFIAALAALAHRREFATLLFIVALVVFLLMILPAFFGGWNRFTGIGPARTQRGQGQGTPAGGASGAGTGGGLRGWLNRVSEEMERRRWKAVEELLTDLQRDPGEALRRALPLNSSTMHRGIAAPGDQLTSNRIPDFSLGRLNQGGPVDNWDLPAHYQQQLRAQYLALAQAEARRGNYRAAAYIHAHLLGDLHSAAAALKGGGHYREAATLYRTRLNNTRAAAECLAAAGCHVEAAELYEELGHHVAAGDAWQNAGDIENARKAWRRAVQEYVDTKNPIGAATLLERKLEEPKEALSVLIAAWPGHALGTAALLAAYDLMAQQQWAAPALELTQQLCGTPPPAVHREPLAKVLTGIARAWPNPLVRETAKEGALELIAGQIKTQDASAVRRAGAILAELEAGDKLLTRDIARFTNGVVEAGKIRVRKAVNRALAHASGSKGLVVEHCSAIEFKDMPGSEFLTGIAGEGNELYVLTSNFEMEGALVLLAGDWFEQTSRTGQRWTGWKRMAGTPTLTLGPHGVLAIGGPSVQILSASSIPGLRPVPRKGKPPLSAGQPSWMHGRDAHVTVCGDLWCLGSPGPDGIRLDFLDATGQQRQSVVAGFESAEPVQRLLLGLAAHGRHVIMAVPQGLMTWYDGTASMEELPLPPLQLAVSPSWARAAVAAGCEQGAYLYWPHSQQVLTLDRDLARPVVGFTGRSHVVALGDREGIAAQAEAGKFTRFQRFPWTYGKPLAILTHPDGDTFGVLTAKGRVEILRIREMG